jgi:hypothetical protein
MDLIDLLSSATLVSITDTVYLSNFFLMFCGLCIVIHLRNKNQQDALFYSQYILIINLYMFQVGLLLIKRYFSVYPASTQST